MILNQVLFVWQEGLIQNQNANARVKSTCLKLTLRPPSRVERDLSEHGREFKKNSNHKPNSSFEQNSTSTQQRLEYDKHGLILPTTSFCAEFKLVASFLIKFERFT